MLKITIVAATMALMVVGCGESSDNTTPPPAAPAPSTSLPNPDYGYVFSKTPVPGADVDATQFGADWPLTVPSGRVNCVFVKDGLMATFAGETEADGKYPLNQVAKHLAAVFALDDIAKITKKDASLQPLIDVCNYLGDAGF